MFRHLRIDWLRIWVVLCITALLCACTSSISSTFSQGGSAMLAVPGTDYKLLMPPPAMQQKIEALIRAGKAPGYTTLPARMIARICSHSEKQVLGCVYETAVGRTIFIADDTRDAARRMVLVHEYAHYLYDWRH